MGLEDNVNLLVAALPGRGQSGANLRGVVAVVVHHRNPAGLAAHLEAPVDPSKMVQSFRNLFAGNAKLVGNGHGGCCVENVVPAGDVEFEAAERPGRRDHLEAREAARFRGEKLQAVVGQRRDAIREDAAAGAGQDAGQ